MKVSANLPSSALVGQAISPPTQPNIGGHRSFAQLLRGANGHRGARIPLPDPAVMAGASHFAVETSIGEDAVRFDARPIVAPTGEATPAAQAGANRLPVAKAAPAAAPTQAELEKLVARLAQFLPAIAEHFANGPDPAPPIATDLGPAQRVGANARTAAGPPPPQGRAISPPLTARTTESSTSRPAAAPPQTSALAARATALPREIIIVLRGITLSADERERLADTMQRELAPLRLSEKTIRIMGAGGKA